MEWNGTVFMERIFFFGTEWNGFYGTDSFWERNGTERNGSSLSKAAEADPPVLLAMSQIMEIPQTVFGCRGSHGVAKGYAG